MKNITDKAIHDKFADLKNYYLSELKDLSTFKDKQNNRISIVDKIETEFSLINKVIKNNHIYMFYYSIDNCIKLTKILSKISMLLQELDVANNIHNLKSCSFLHDNFNLSAKEFLKDLNNYHDTKEFLNIFNQDLKNY